MFKEKNYNLFTRISISINIESYLLFLLPIYFYLTAISQANELNSIHFSELKYLTEKIYKGEKSAAVLFFEELPINIGYIRSLFKLEKIDDIGPRIDIYITKPIKYMGENAEIFGDLEAIVPHGDEQVLSIICNEDYEEYFDVDVIMNHLASLYEDPITMTVELASNIANKKISGQCVGKYNFIQGDIS